MKNILIRSLTGIIYALIIGGSVFFHPYAFLLLFVAITGLSLWEFHSFTGHREMLIPGVIGGIWLFIASFFFAGGYVGSYIFIPYILLLLFIIIRTLYLKMAKPVDSWSVALFAQLYCAGFFSLLNFVAFDAQTFSYSPCYVLLIFAFVWLNDTGAYLVGTAFGKHKMFPRISPLKSWEGFAGGLFATLLFSILLSQLCPNLMAIYHWPALAIIVVVFATWGDLVESQIKRHYGVKDSGTLLPGHGGILDRLDSIILATPAAYVYIEYIIQS